MIFISKLIGIGVFKNTLNLEIKRIKILNYCCAFGLFTAFFFLGFDFFLNLLDFKKVISFFVQIVVFTLIFFLQYRKQYEAARLLFLGLIFESIFYNANFAFVGFYGEYNYLILPLLSLFFFDKKYIHYLVLVLAICLFYIPNYYYKIYPEEYFGYLNVLFQFFGTFIIVNYFKSQNQKNEIALQKSYVKLEEAKEHEVAHLQLKSLRAQMNPHFMFNAMNSIQSLVLKGDKYEAYNYLTKFASLIRENLNMSEKSFTEFDEELALLKKYLELEELRFQENFEYEIIGEHEIGAIKIPSMIIQPFIENAIKHGLLHKIDGIKKVKISFIQEEVFKCIITDNGIGLKVSQAINKANHAKEISFSTKAIKERLTLLKNYYKADIGIVYEDVQIGTSVVIKIPYTTFE